MHDAPGYYIVDGRNRLEMARLRSELDMLPCMVFDFDGPQHEAAVFVELQRYRKPLVTKDLHTAELFAAGEFGAIARAAEDFVRDLECESVPLASIRKLVKARPHAFERIAPLVGPLVGPATLAKDFIEALVYLADELTPEMERRLHAIGYEHVLTGMQEYQARNMAGRFAKFASPKQKAEALRAVLTEGPIDYSILPRDAA